MVGRPGRRPGGGNVAGMPAEPTPTDLAPQDLTCPRCARPVRQRFYGPCDECRAELRRTGRAEARIVEVAEYEPKMNVTPNAVATKDD